MIKKNSSSLMTQNSKSGVLLHQSKNKQLSKSGTKCEFCKNNAETVLEVTNVFLCRRCYNRILEKRTLRFIGKTKMIKPYDKVTLIADGSAGSGVLLSIFQILLSKLPFSVFVFSKNSEGKKQAEKYNFKEVKKKTGKIMSPLLLDDASREFLSSILENKPKKALRVGYKSGREYFPLLKIERIQAEKYCNFRKIPFSKRINKTDADIMILDIAKAKPSINFCLIKTREQLK